MLSDKTIRRLVEKGELTIDVTDGECLFDDQFQPASVDLRLGGLSYKDGTPAGLPSLRANRCAWLPARKFMIGSTIEFIGLCENLVGNVEGKSTCAREGLMVEAAGLVDPGFRGQLTLELFNMSDEPIRLNYGALICQLTLDWMDTTPDRTYGHSDLGSHYQGQQGPTKSWRMR